MVVDAGSKNTTKKTLSGAKRKCAKEEFDRGDFVRDIP